MDSAEHARIPPDKRLGALGRILAIEAGQHPNVRAFRRKYLGDETIQADAAPWWIAGQGDTEMTCGSALWHLHQTAAMLGKLYGWSAPRAVQFVLTGEPPPIPKAVTKTVMNFAVPALNRIELSVDPRLNSQEVADLYASIRSEIRQGRDKPMGEKHLALAVWLARHYDGETNWGELQGRWNQEHPGE